MSDDQDLDEQLERNGLYRCWCGEIGVFEEMCDQSCMSDTCGGTGSIQCECGGDICVCHNHGEIACDGCEDCEFNEYDDVDREIDFIYDDDWNEVEEREYQDFITDDEAWSRRHEDSAFGEGIFD